MEQKEVKIIGLKINQQIGILQSCQLQFSTNNNLIAVKGEVGSGKTTLQKGLMLGTLGSDTLKDDKSLYGEIDEEVQLIDGEENIFVGCKSSKDGSLMYTIYTKDEDGKVIKEPVIDGVKLTPSAYLKSLQTALTWRMDELTSENHNVQKKILLELYKKELAAKGVVFDKKSQDYSQSILGKIELAENDRSEKEFLRKQVGGFKTQLAPLGINVENSDTIPKYIDISKLEADKVSLQYKINNVEEVKAQALKTIKNNADEITNKLKEENAKIKEQNKVLQSEFETKKDQHSQNIHTYNGISKDLETLNVEKCLSDEDYEKLYKLLDTSFKNTELTTAKELPELEFDETGKCTTKEWEKETYIAGLLDLLIELKLEYIQLNGKPVDDTAVLEKDLSLIVDSMLLAKENNRKVEMVNTFLNWQAANDLVVSLRNEYTEMLLSINTGVEGLNICVDKEDGKLDIYLTYDGSYDPKYFSNKNLENRKLSSYSGTQKPLICLLLQNYLLSKKPKAMRYLWIDDVPIDKKTRLLLEEMGEDLGLTIIVNITGDFEKENLTDGELLIDGGEIFFK